MALIRDHYGYRDFALDRLTRRLYAWCWAGDDRPSLFLGRYVFTLPEPIAKGQLRSLRTPAPVAGLRAAL